MSTNHEHEPIEVDASKGYEASDVCFSGILVFLTALTVLVAATGLLVYGMGKVLNARMEKQDGAAGRWTKQIDVRDLGNLANSPELQQKTNELMQKYPTPRLQFDQGDGAEDIFSLHQREDLLLEHYSWADQSKGKVRIPIDRAIDLIVAKGLPVAPAATESPLLAGDEKPVVTKPLTNGFARTGYEQAVAQQEAIDSRKVSTASSVK